MIHPLTHVKPFRIEVVDALRGFAVLAIVLVHNIEHFNLYTFPETSSALLTSVNTFLWEAIFFFFGGKAYAIFALLFGFSFHIQFSNRQRKGEDFAGRFAWRLVWLGGFGLFHAVFYPGDILTLYAIIGFVLIPVRKLKSKWVCLIAILLMLQPMEIGKLFYACLQPGYVIPEGGPDLWPLTQEGLKSSSFITLVEHNLRYGEWYSLTWAWDNGRFFQTASLFMLGMLLARKELFTYSDQHIFFWKKVLLIAILSFIPLYILKIYLAEFEMRRELLMPLNTTVASWSNVSFMFILVSGFILLWYQTHIQTLLAKLVPYGKMSLTNYIGQSIMGSFIYYGYGLAWYQYMGVTLSMLMGIVLFLLQLYFCRWWLARYKQGPLETVWHKITWIKFG